MSNATHLSGRELLAKASEFVEHGMTLSLEFGAGRLLLRTSSDFRRPTFVGSAWSSEKARWMYQMSQASLVRVVQQGARRPLTDRNAGPFDEQGCTWIRTPEGDAVVAYLESQREENT